MTSRLSIAPTGKHPILLRDESGKRITHRAPVLANGAPGRNKTAILTSHHQEKMVSAAAFLSSYRNETHLT